MTSGIRLDSLLKSCDKTDMKFRLSAGIMIGKHIVLIELLFMENYFIANMQNMELFFTLKIKKLEIILN